MEKQPWISLETKKYESLSGTNFFLSTFLKNDTSRPSELHRWPTHKELLIYVSGLSKETNDLARRQLIGKHLESIQMKEQLMLLTMKDCALDDKDVEQYIIYDFASANS